MDVSETIAPKSDQIGYEDFLGGPRTLSITEVRRGPSADQPIEVLFSELDRPWRPAKTVRRVLVSCWGPNGEDYVGRRVTLFGDPTVRWAGAEIGGIRMSHASHIDKPVTVSLTVSRGKRSPFTVQVLKDAPKPPAAPDKVQAAVTAITNATDANKLAEIEAHAVKVGLASNPAIVNALKTKRDELSF